ncbi:MAG: PP2C family protein-serine/threonine phosphatase [Dermatophilaceae bacterium]
MTMMMGASRRGVRDALASLQRVLPRRAALTSDVVIVAGFVAATLAVGLAIATWPDYVPVAVLFSVVVGAGLLLPPRRLLVVLVAIAGVAAVWVPQAGVSLTRIIGLLASLVVVSGLVVAGSWYRSRLGTRGFGGDRMFADLRDRIIQVGQIPSLPPGWSVTSSVRSAHFDRFSGDFVVAHVDEGTQRLQVVVVDVSGKGAAAGTRALLLSGALGGLLGSVPGSRFVEFANDYLVRQGWGEGFATAVHLELDLGTGSYAIVNAGHPAPACYSTVRGRWTLLDASHGPLLGVMPGVSFPRMSGTLNWGDVLLLYSDGVVELRGRDLHDGVDRMLGVAERAVVGSLDIAREVCEQARSGDEDDRAAVAIRRL